jgi:hypothetical protein
MQIGHEHGEPGVSDGCVYVMMGLYSQPMCQAFKHSDSVSCLQEKKGLKYCYLHRYIFNRKGDFKLLGNGYTHLEVPSENQKVLIAYLHKLFSIGCKYTKDIQLHDSLWVDHSPILDDGPVFVNGEETTLRNLSAKFAF